MASNQRLVVLDDQGKKWDVMEALASSYSSRTGKTPVFAENEIILERWTVQLGEHAAKVPADLTNILPLVYKKSIVLFRSLFTYSKFLPAWKFSRGVGKVRSHSALKLRYRIVDGTQTDRLSRSDNLHVPLHESKDRPVSDYAFGVTDSPAGPFSVEVTYRTNCDFRIDDSEALLSSRFLGTDDEIFRPSLPTEAANDKPRPKDAHEVGSLPTQSRRPVSPPDPGQAYGSLSTFHQVGPATGSSPISALRNAQELGYESPPSALPTRPAPHQRSPPTSRPAIAGVSGPGRRPSISFQPFKAPSLSASPAMSSPLASSPRTSLGRVPVLASLNEARGIPSQIAPLSPVQKNAPKLPENAIVSSASSSPKPAPINRYSSSFSHRRARLSSGGTTKTDDDQNSSGRGSAASSAAHPGSSLLAEVGAGSSGSVNDDDENISDFLKMLDLKKDLLTPSDSASTEASTRRTAAALNRYHRMRDTNRELSDSMSSSLLLRAGGSSGSSSRQLSSVPPMVPATSVSTSSSPGKPISPHTPHTPAIPSRLSAASNVDYGHQEPGERRHRLSHEEHGALSEEATSEDTTVDTSTINVNAIPIPTSPRPFLPAYRRSSSAAQRRASPEVDELADLYGMRPASMGAGERQSRTRSAATVPQESTELGDGPLESLTGAVDVPSSPPEVLPRQSSLRHKTTTTTLPPHDGAGSGSASGNSFTHHVYRSRLARGGQRGRGTPPQGSSSSFGGATGDSGSGLSDRRGRGPSFSRPESKYEEDEPFLFAMSDIGASRRSLEEPQGGTYVAKPVEKVNEADSARRGNKRGGGVPGAYPAW